MTSTLPVLRNAALACVLAVAAAGPALAQSTDLSTWTPLGDTALAAGSALLSTASTESGEAPLHGGSALLYTDLEAAMGTAFDADTFEGSGLQSSFAAAAGTRVTAQWTLATGEYDAGFADRAYAVVDGVATPLASVQAGARSGSFTHTFATSGMHTLGFALLDVNDTAGVSTLTVSGLSVSAVPEPGNWALLLAGLGVTGAVARRRAAQSTR